MKNRKELAFYNNNPITVISPDISAIKNGASKTLLISKSCVVLKTQQANMLLHNHRCFELVYVLNGTVSQHIEKKGVVSEYQHLGVGNFIFIDYNTFHDYQNASHDLVLINFLFTPDFLIETAGECTLSELCRHQNIDFDVSLLKMDPADRVYYDSDGQILALFEKALDVYHKNLPGHHALLRCMAIEILLTAFQQHLPNLSGRPKHKAIQEICDYVMENYTENITLSKICQEKYFNSNYISKKFYEVTGMTFNKYLQKVRIQNACELLIETDASIEMVSEMVGYNDVHSFRTVFKKIIGSTPREFQKIYSGRSLTK